MDEHYENPYVFLLHHIKIEMKKKSSETIQTTASEERKANAVKRCLISIMKLFRVCKKSRKKQ